MRRSAESNAYSQRRSPSTMTTQASRSQICGSAGNGIRYGTIRVFKKFSRLLNQRRCTNDVIGAGTPPSRGSRASRLHPARMLWWQACRLRVLRIAADTAASTEVVDSTRWGQLSRLVYKKPAHSLEHLIELVCGHLSDRVKNEVLLDAEKALRANEARLIDLAPL